MTMLAKCSECGSIDERRRWSSADDAAKQGVFDRWTCPICAWTEFELVDASEAGSKPEAHPVPDRR